MYRLFARLRSFVSGLRQPGHIVLQVGTGVVVGAAIAMRLLTNDGSSTARAAVFLGSVALLTLGTGSLAALGPARRGLRIQPLEALRSDWDYAFGPLRGSWN